MHLGRLRRSLTGHGEQDCSRQPSGRVPGPAQADDPAALNERRRVNGCCPAMGAGLAGLQRSIPGPSRTARAHENHEPQILIFPYCWTESKAHYVVSPKALSAPGPVFRPLVTEFRIMWKKPEFTEMRFGFEVTMYIYNR